MWGFRQGYGAAVLALVACGPSVDPSGAGDSASESGSSGDTASTTGTTSGPSTTSPTEPSSTSVAPTTGGSSGGTGDVLGPPLCLGTFSSNVPISDDHLVDVDGDAAPELWTIAAGATPPWIRHFVIDSQGEQLVYDARRDGTAFGFGDIDGDGHDDLVAQTVGGPAWYAGLADGSLADVATPATVPDGQWSFAFADLDGDGDDDMVRLSPGVFDLEILRNTDGTFVVEDGFPPPTWIGADAQILGVWATGADRQFVVQLGPPPDDENTISALARIDLSADASQFIGVRYGPDEILRYLGDVDIDGDDEPDLLAEFRYGNQTDLFVLEPDMIQLVPQVLIDGATRAVVGDFEGTGAPSLIYEDANGLRLHRFEDGSEHELILLDDRGGFEMYRGVDFENDGVSEVYASFCELGCWAAIAYLTPCPD